MVSKASMPKGMGDEQEVLLSRQADAQKIKLHITLADNPACVATLKFPNTPLPRAKDLEKLRASSCSRN